ncbi:MAG: DUF2382 domain-containing protein [Sphingobacteriales bacterium]|nr:MAG: DUF2382 domain-containing protein [Sphingobacteriales bacterium]
MTDQEQPLFPDSFRPGESAHIVSGTTGVPASTPTIPVIEEQATVSAKMVEKGRVLITKTVDDHPETIDVVSTHDETDVERVPINRMVDAPPVIRYEGDTMIIPVVKEVAVVEKKLMLTEEVRITRRKVQTQEAVPVTLRKEHIDIVRETLPEQPDTTGQKL